LTTVTEECTNPSVAFYNPLDDWIRAAEAVEAEAQRTKIAASASILFGRN